LAENLADCRRDRRHVYYRALPVCPWCSPTAARARRDSARRPGSLRPNPRGPPAVGFRATTTSRLVAP
jgi:hypothetical protein